MGSETFREEEKMIDTNDYIQFMAFQENEKELKQKEQELKDNNNNLKEKEPISK